MTNFLRVSIRHVCPACLDGPLFARGYELNACCPVCGLDLIGRDGAQYGGPMVLGYTLGGIAGLLTVLSVILAGGSASVSLWSGLCATVVTIFLTWRHCKAAWTWLLFRTGQLDRRDAPT